MSKKSISQLTFQLLVCQIGFMRVRFLESIEPFLNDGIEQVRKSSIRLLVTSYATHGHDIRVPRVVNSSLNDVIDGVTRGRFNAKVFGVDGGRETFRHPVVVF